MREKIYDDGLVTICRQGPHFFIKYDAGSHQVVLREDEISEEEATLAMKGAEEASRVLFKLQQRLEQAGIDPYVSNVNAIPG
jgi:hypothetical protein